ncbi:MAG: formylglycine-generating enzyme family protein, partial [Calditrichia bacterium]
NPSKFVGANRPIEQVNFFDVEEFVEKSNGECRLPSEAEWEYASRGGANARYYWGNMMDDAYAWYADNSGEETHPVGEKLPNQYGLYDMMGNVWEWCSDLYNRNYYKNSPAKDPEGPSGGATRVLRGGGWKSKPEQLRTVDRNDFVPTSKKFANIGLRLARSP